MTHDRDDVERDYVWLGGSLVDLPPPLSGDLPLDNRCTGD
jgi:hypothetical protein